MTGTYGYMAPEQFRGAAQPASDLYALGGTLLYLLSGVLRHECPAWDCLAVLAINPSIKRTKSMCCVFPCLTAFRNSQQCIAFLEDTYKLCMHA